MERKFIKANETYCSFENHVPAPYFRKSFELEFIPEKAQVAICGQGFYRLFINGQEVTKGYLAPYISNPDHILYVDTYEVAEQLVKGKNVIGIILGNGFYNNPGGSIWDFDKAIWRGTPRLALEFSANKGEKMVSFHADETFKVHPSPIIFDDLRMGEWYDARLESKGWSLPDFEDEKWENAQTAESPRGEFKKCEAEPIKVTREIKPVAIIKKENGYLYDFGENTAGLLKLKIQGACGQKISVRHGECLDNGEFANGTMIFNWVDSTFYKENMQHTVYIAKGGEVEEYTPSFTYYGFRYAFVEGITEAQATTDLLTYQVMHSDLKKIGYFKCSDKTANTLMEMVERSDLANFYYFPTDCPHREKNGWTGDAQLSAAHLTYLFDVEKSYTEWLHNIRKAQKEAGDIPGIIPTGDWGYAWGNGPAWDAALFELPYQLFKKKGNCKVIKENAQAMIRYLSYILTQRSENGTIGIGLGDYLPVGKEAEDHDTPIYVTSTLCVMDMARKAQEMFEAIGYKHQANFARAVYEDLRSTIRKELVDSKQKQMKCHTQTAQAMALYYGVFDEDEEQQAFKELLDLIHQNGENFDCGILGTRVIFSVLAKYGEAELAYHMITKSEYPSFGHLIELGETSVTECFIPDDHPRRLKISHNHHFFGDIARVFIEDVAGLKIIDEKNITIMPHFIKQLSFAEAGHDLPLGQVKVAWERKADKIQLKVEHPKEVNCHVVLPTELKEKIEIL